MSKQNVTSLLNNNPNFSILDNKEIQLNKDAEKEWAKYVLENNLNEKNPEVAGEKIRFIYSYKFDPNFREERKYSHFREVDGGKKSRKSKKSKKSKKIKKSKKLKATRHLVKRKLSAGYPDPEEAPYEVSLDEILAEDGDNAQLVRERRRLEAEPLLARQDPLAAQGEEDDYQDALIEMQIYTILESGLMPFNEDDLRELSDEQREQLVSYVDAVNVEAGRGRPNAGYIMDRWRTSNLQAILNDAVQYDINSVLPDAFGGRKKKRKTRKKRLSKSNRKQIYSSCKYG